MRKWLTVGGVCLFATLVMAAAKTRNQYRSLVPGVGVVIDTLCVDADPDTLSISDDLSKKYSVHGAEFRLQTVSWLSGGDRCSLEVYGICNAADTLRDTIVHTASGTIWSDSLTWTKIIALYTHGTSADSTDSVAVLGWATNIDWGTSDVPFENVHADSFHGHHHGMGDSATYADTAKVVVEKAGYPGNCIPAWLDSIHGCSQIVIDPDSIKFLTDSLFRVATWHNAIGIDCHAPGQHATVSGGLMDTASGEQSVVAGGMLNIASDDYATVGGGLSNQASGSAAAVSGGLSNKASGSAAAVSGGLSNIASDDYATVGGGLSNQASGSAAAVSGGLSNQASGSAAAVSGGLSNIASDDYATVGGGASNEASGNCATIAGGKNNTATGDYVAVSGGRENTASGQVATVSGGYNNTASGVKATVGGGDGNTASSELATVAGGYINDASGQHATVGGGEDNTASQSWCVVGGGIRNTASDTCAAVAGGYENRASGNFATIPGGQDNLVESRFGFAVGYLAQVWGDAADSASMVLGTGVVDSVPYACIINGDGDDTLSTAHHTLIGTDATVDGSVTATSYSGTSDMYNDSAGLFLRRDGTASLTGDLTVDDVDIRGIETVEADTAIINDYLRVDGGIYNVGVETIVANKSKRQVYLKDAGGDYLVWQNYYWNGSAWVATNGYGYGRQALQNNTGPYSNSYGHYASQNNTGEHSNGFGHYASQNNTGDYSSGFGSYTGQNNTGDYSNGFGSYALRYNTGIKSNSYGHCASQNNTGEHSNGFGFQVMKNNTGDYSSGFGSYTLRHNQNDNNIALGHGAWDGFLSNTGGNKTFDHSAVDAATDRITVTTHGFGATNVYKNLQYTEGTDPIGGLTNGSIYQIKIIDANTIGFYEGNRGTNITSAGSGTGHTLTPQYDYTNSVVIGVNQDPTASNQVILGNSSITQTLLRGNVETGGNVTADTIKNNVLQLKRSEVRLWKPEEGACASCGSGVDWYIGAANGTAYQGLDPLPYYLGGSICKLDSVEIVSWKAGVYDSCRVYLGSVNFTGANDADVYLGSITHGNSSSKYRDKFSVNQALNVDKRFYLEFRFYTVSGTEANLEIISTNLIYKSNF